jgi:two-component system response regulator MprA
MRALLVEDRLDIGHAITQAAVNEGLVMDWASTVAGAMEALDTNRYMAAIIRDTIDSERRISDRILGIRESGLLGLAGPEVADRIAMLQNGYDDAMSPPYSIREILVRCRSCAGKWRERSRRILTYSYLTLDIGLRRVFVDGYQVPMMSSMWALLEVAARNPGFPVMSSVAEECGGTRKNFYLDVYRIGRRLTAWGHPQLIHVHGKDGFVLEDRGHSAVKNKDKFEHLLAFLKSLSMLKCPRDYEMLAEFSEAKQARKRKKPTP